MISHVNRSVHRNFDKLKPVSGSRPCERCGGDHKCSYGDSPRRVMCGRLLDSPIHGWRPGDWTDGTFSLFYHDDGSRGGYDRDEAKYQRWLADQRSKAKAAASPPASPSRDWAADAERFRLNLQGPMKGQADWLASELKTPKRIILDRYGYVITSWSEEEPDPVPAFTRPERDADGKVIGIQRRRKSDGDKRVIGKSGRGIYIDDGWDLGGAINLVEGASDVDTLFAAGLTAIGRPNNTGGVEHLIGFLRRYPGREIVVWGENDQKENGEWPGLASVGVAKKLAEGLNRPIRWAFPPDGVKDCRKWFNAVIGDRFEDPAAWSAVAKTFLERTTYETASPPLTPEQQAAALFGTEVRPRADHLPELPQDRPAPFVDDEEPSEPPKPRCPNRLRVAYENADEDRQKVAETFCKTLSCEVCHEIKKQEYCFAIEKHVTPVESVWLFGLDSSRWAAGYKSMERRAKRRGLSLDYATIENGSGDIFVITPITPPENGARDIVQMTGPEAVARFTRAIGTLDRYSRNKFTSSHSWSVTQAFPAKIATGKWKRVSGIAASMERIEDILYATAGVSDIKVGRKPDGLFYRKVVQWSADEKTRLKVTGSMLIGEVMPEFDVSSAFAQPAQPEIPGWESIVGKVTNQAAY